LRKVAAAALAIPVLAVLYLPVVARRSIAARIGLGLGVGIAVVIAGLGFARPTPTQAVPPAPPIRALPDDAFRTIGATVDLHAPIEIDFSEAMDTGSVAASLVVSPSVPVTTSWNAAHTALTVRPSEHWSVGTYHSVSVVAGALAATGRPMSTAARAVFVTRAATTGRIEATDALDREVSIGTAFRLTFDRPVSTSALRAAIRTSPAVAGELVPVSARPDVDLATASSFTFTPTKALTAGRTYRLSVDATGLVDEDGAAVQALPALAVTTTDAPRLVRFRPANKLDGVDRHAAISVRFTEAMNHTTTRSAFSVSIAGKKVAGRVRFAEGDTVLVFQPASALPAGALVRVAVVSTATSKTGVPLAKGRAIGFRTVEPPAPRTTGSTTPTTSGSGGGGSSSGGSSGGGSGGAVGGGSWGAVETYYLGLMNCTRTGGWVTSTGSCSSPGGRNVAPLRLDAGISSKVSRPYAKKLAVNNLCTHFSGGNPGDRLRAAGYTSYRWAENLGCRSGNPYSAVLGSHLFFQAEKPTNGGHYVNLMNAAYDRCGIGVWVSGGRVRLVIDFYHPL
jgi:uncharacterized protein YkwD